MLNMLKTLEAILKVDCETEEEAVDKAIKFIINTIIPSLNGSIGWLIKFDMILEYLHIDVDRAIREVENLIRMIERSDRVERKRILRIT